MSSFMAIPLFALMLFTCLLSLSGLMYGDVLFLRTQESISEAKNPLRLIQYIYAQEENEDEEDDGNEEAETNNEEDEQAEKAETDSDTNSIDICCAWDERIADGILTYRIIEENEDDDEENGDEGTDENEDDNPNKDYNSVPVLTNAVANAMKEWNAKVPNLKVIEVSSTSAKNDDADIEVRLVEGFGGMVAGATMIKYDEDGLINKVTIILPKAAFYVEYDSEVFGVQYSSEKLEEIAVHEMGHALGLGHANFDADIMSQRLRTEETVSISQCDVNGILLANHWKLVKNDNIADNPNEDEVNC
jgi:hypothetical protein